VNAMNPIVPGGKASCPIKCFGHYAPLHADEASDWNKSVLDLTKARKIERKQRKKIELKFISSTKRKKSGP